MAKGSDPQRHHDAYRDTRGHAEPHLDKLTTTGTHANSHTYINHREISSSISFPPGRIKPAGGLSASNILTEAVPPGQRDTCLKTNLLIFCIVCIT